MTKLKFMGTATMEDSRIDFENTRFDNLDTRSLDAVNAIDGTYSALLNPALTGGEAVGPAKSLQVKKGDVVTMEVLASYVPPGQDNTYITGLATLLTSAFGINTGTTEGATVADGMEDAVTGNAMVPNPTNARLPKAYLQFLLFDENYNFIGAESGDCDCFKKVTTAAANNVETLSLEVEYHFFNDSTIISGEFNLISETINSEVIRARGTFSCPMRN